MSTVPAASPPPSPPRRASLDAVLTHAWSSAEFTATDAIAATGLTRSTAIDAMATLADLGLLRELPNAREAGAYRKGRPARRFELRGDAAVLVGVDVGNAHITARVADLRSVPLSTRRVELEPDRDDAPTRARLIVRAVDDALETAGRTRADVLSLCAGVPAPVDAHGRSPRSHDSFWGRMNPGLIDALGWAPLVRIDNDASLAALAEGTSGSAVGCRNYITLLAGARLGAGVVIDGHLLRGTHGGVGEMRAFDHVTGVGTANGVGAMAARWAAEAIADGTLPADSALRTAGPGRADGWTVFELAAGGDAGAGEIVERAGRMLGRIAAVLASMFDPERIVISGRVSPGMEQLLSTARPLLPAGVDLPAPELMVSRLGVDAVLIGAVASAAATARSHALDLWLAR